MTQLSLLQDEPWVNCRSAEKRDENLRCGGPGGHHKNTTSQSPNSPHTGSAASPENTQAIKWSVKSGVTGPMLKGSSEGGHLEGQSFTHIGITPALTPLYGCVTVKHVNRFRDNYSDSAGTSSSCCRVCSRWPAPWSEFCSCIGWHCNLLRAKRVSSPCRKCFLMP